MNKDAKVLTALGGERRSDECYKVVKEIMNACIANEWDDVQLVEAVMMEPRFNNEFERVWCAYRLAKVFERASNPFRFLEIGSDE